MNLLRWVTPAATVLAFVAGHLITCAQSPTDVVSLPKAWEYSAALIAPESREDEPSYAQKDPTLVFHDGRWHVFMTVKLPGRSAIEYCSFSDWDAANQSKRVLLPVSESDYYCAPQVFFYRPHKLWYLIYQMGVPNANKMAVAYSTTDDITNPNSWSKAQLILDGGPSDPRVVGGLDFWIICDDTRAHLFFTSLNGKMWRMWTTRDEFPLGFRDCQVALDADIFEASHTYRLKDRDAYLTIIEQKGQRYFKAYIADKLDGQWTPIADTRQHPFAANTNTQPLQNVEAWTDNISHGELIRDSNDERLIVDPDHFRVVFQGLLESEKQGKPYGQFTWRIGMLTPLNDSE
ncbi:hypothetical protein NHH03_05425 [Stieleria sp. TO1_6]|uniref:non-reducing end alpha-L-arabinofuranosidase family hydrolase n=1 Tax=Stieleria tagensis TaxID=2956795 RepID=UPI00209B31E7|nr:non-reducing end alpha-L-arabinofuranosidase family hydrolase [Stieleria tagensis]MCO8121169.1 hypothetical protein [Stieleria tagensis]